MSRGVEKQTMNDRHPSAGNLFERVQTGALQEQITSLIARNGVRIERIVSTGQASPPDFWYDQDEDEWVVLISGQAMLTVEGLPEPLRLTPGSWVDLPARRRHRVEWTQADPPTIWLAIFSPASS